MLGLVNNLKIKFHLQTQYLRCDNACENQAFEKNCKKEGLGNDFEFIAPGMPQQNEHVEHNFATLFNWVCAVLNGGKFTAFL